MFKQLLTLNNFLKNGLHIGMRLSKLNNHQNKFTLGIFKCFTIFNYRGIFFEIFRFWNIFSLIQQHKQVNYFFKNTILPTFPEFFPIFGTENQQNYLIFQNLAEHYEVSAFLNLYNLAGITNKKKIEIYLSSKKKFKNITNIEIFFENIKKNKDNSTFLLYSKKKKTIKFSNRNNMSLKKHQLLNFFKKNYLFYAAFLDSEDSPHDIPYKFIGNTKFFHTLYFFSKIFLRTQNTVNELSKTLNEEH